MDKRTSAPPSKRATALLPGVPITAPPLLPLSAISPRSSVVESELLRGQAAVHAHAAGTTRRIAAMCSGPEAQQPPTICAPASSQSDANRAMRDGE